jgi:hypothetical protein
MNILHRLILEPLGRSYESFLLLLPGVFTSIVLVVVGVVMGVIARRIFLRVFLAVRFDGLAQRLGGTQFLSRAGIKNLPSYIVSKLIQWIIIITFLIVAMQNLKIPTVEHLVERFFLYLPNVFVAAFILIIGYFFSNFLGRAALIALVNAGIRNSGFAAKFVRFIVFLLTATMALEQLGIGRDTVIVAFAITFGGVMLAFSIAFGFAGRDTAKKYLERKGKEDADSDDIAHL